MATAVFICFRSSIPTERYNNDIAMSIRQGCSPCTSSPGGRHVTRTVTAVAQRCRTGQKTHNHRAHQPAGMYSGPHGIRSGAATRLEPPIRSRLRCYGASATGSFSGSSGGVAFSGPLATHDRRPPAIGRPDASSCRCDGPNDIVSHHLSINLVARRRTAHAREGATRSGLTVFAGAPWAAQSWVLAAALAVARRMFFYRTFTPPPRYVGTGTDGRGQCRNVTSSLPAGDPSTMKPASNAGGS
jgi:hypothetical protein